MSGGQNVVKNSWFFDRLILVPLSFKQVLMWTYFLSGL